MAESELTIEVNPADIDATYLTSSVSWGQPSQYWNSILWWFYSPILSVVTTSSKLFMPSTPHIRQASIISVLILFMVSRVRPHDMAGNIISGVILSTAASFLLPIDLDADTPLDDNATKAVWTSSWRRTGWFFHENVRISENAGYIHYEVSNLPGVSYWFQGIIRNTGNIPLPRVGPSAHSLCKESDGGTIVLSADISTTSKKTSCHRGSEFLTMEQLRLRPFSCAPTREGIHLSNFRSNIIMIFLMRKVKSFKSSSLQVDWNE